MAEPVKRGLKWRHAIMVKGNRLSGTFDSKKEAKQWEAEMRFGARSQAFLDNVIKKKHPLRDAVDKYLLSITPLKKNAEEWETRRFNEMLQAFPGKNIEDITAADVALWRDRLLQRVSGSTVNRYINLYGNLFTIARREWKWIDHNPFSDVKRPRENDPRQKVWRWQDIKRVLREGQRRGGKYHEVTVAFRLSLHTAMRLNEALMAPLWYDKRRMVITVPAGYKGSLRAMEMPTTRRARRVLDGTPPFKTRPNEASVLFSKLCSELLIKGMQFRDARATALTLLSRKTDILRLIRISRHKNAELLRSTYYREDAAEISRSL